MKKRFLAGLLATVVLALGVTGCSSSNQKDNKVVIYTSMEDYRNQEMETQLKDKFPELNVVVQYYSTGNNTAKIKAEGTKSEADIVIGLETASMMQIADNFADLSSFTTEQYLDGVNDSDNRYFTWEKADGGIIVNTKVLAEKGLAEPTSYDDLLKPEYKDLIAMPNPKTSNTGYMFLNTWVNMWGEEKALNYVDQLQSNVKSFTESGSGPVKMLVQGEAAIGIGMVFQAAQQITDGAPLKFIQFAEGCPYNTTAIGIIKGRETDENVVKVFEYLDQDFNAYDKMYFVPGQLLKNQEIKLENYPTDIRYSDMSTISDIDVKQQLLSKWKY